MEKVPNTLFSTLRDEAPCIFLNERFKFTEKGDIVRTITIDSTVLTVSHPRLFELLIQPCLEDADREGLVFYRIEGISQVYIEIDLPKRSIKYSAKKRVNQSLEWSRDNGPSQ